MEITLIAIGVFGLVGGFSLLALAPRVATPEELVQQRIQAIVAGSGRFVGGSVSLLDSGEEQNFWERTAEFFLGKRDLPEEYGLLSRLLHQAGYSGQRSIRIFWGVRIFLTIALATGAFFVTALSAVPVSKVVLIIVTSALTGYLLPYLNIRRKARYRMRDIRESFPDTLDLLVVCVEAGLGIDAALVRVAKEQASQGLAIGEELMLMSKEMQAGMNRREALTRLGDRLDIEEIKGLTAFLIQTEELGGSIARALRVYADTMRQKRRQKAEEAARKLVIKLLFPLALFIMPALFLVALSPPAINIAKLFASAPRR
jgi:tight adherence protein C